MSDFALSAFDDYNLDTELAEFDVGNVGAANEALVTPSRLVAWCRPSRERAAFGHDFGGAASAIHDSAFSAGGVYALVGVLTSRSLWLPTDDSKDKDSETSGPVCRSSTVPFEREKEGLFGQWNGEGQDQYGLPEAASDEGIIKCASCKYSQYGTSLAGTNAQACKQRFTLVLIPLAEYGNMKMLKSDIVAALKERGKPVPPQLAITDADARIKVYEPDTRFSVSSGSDKIPSNPGVICMTVNASTAGKAVKQFIALAADSGASKRRPSWRVPVSVKPTLTEKNGYKLAGIEVSAVPGATVAEYFTPAAKPWFDFINALMVDLVS